jgi:molybdate transport system substrate-binding protein
MKRFISLQLSALLLLVVTLPDAHAEEVKALFPAAMRHAIAELAAQFEQSSSHKLKIEFGTVGAIMERLKKGEAVDVAVVTDERLAELTSQSRVYGEGQGIVAQVGIGVFGRKGESKPDIGSVEALRQALLDAKAIVYGDPALGDSSGIFAADLIERLGITANMKPKTTLVHAGGKGEMVASGGADIGFDQMSNVVVNPKLEPLGRLPTTLQHFTKYAAGVVSTAAHADAGKALIQFLRSPASQNVLRQKGFEPW